MLERQPTLLVVDDEPDVVKSVQDLLRYDYRVLGATRAAQGREILDREDVDVVMSDQRMPETTGVEFLRAVREDHPDAVRLLFTGYADLRAVIAAINQGNVYRYIQKPWDPDELQTVVRDAVELHDLMAERKQLLAELQRRNEDLQAANAELERASALQVGFIEVVSHELRTPLTILLGLSRLAAGMPDLPAPLRDWLERIHQASQRLQRLVEQIVAMLMAGKFQQTLQCERVTLDRLLADAADDVRPFIELRRQTLRLEGVAPDLGSLPLDASKIRDCLNHLLLNAIKFTPDGGRITLAARRENGDVEIRVRDNGIGIGPEVEPLLFEPFFTGGDTKHHSSGLFEYQRKGLGLGLSVVKAFVEMHGGTIEVRSRQTGPDRGTTFTVTLPDGAQQGMPS
jgi:signal transduction histidine kinase